MIMYKEKEGKFFDMFDAFLFTGLDSIPEDLKYSEDNPKGLMESNIPVVCNRCFQPADRHALFLDSKNNYTRLVCPGTYILYKGSIPYRAVFPFILKEKYYEIEVTEVEYDEVEAGTDTNREEN